MTSDQVTKTASRRSDKSNANRPSFTRLVVVYPPSVQEIKTLNRVQNEVGRETDSNAIQHATVSRRHLRIDWKQSQGAYVVQDLKSHNGSTLNGEELGQRSALLRNNDLLRLGDVLAVFEYSANPPAETKLVDMHAVPGLSLAVAELRSQIARAAEDPAPVLLIGDTGTGKEYIAKELHRLSQRQGRFVSVNCAAVAPTLVESQLFGHKKGAFTGAEEQKGLFLAANKGSLFLDEIGEMPLDQQPKLLRALQEGEIYPVGGTLPERVDVRIIAATNKDLVQATEQALFRRDLYARLALWELRLPSLKQRRVDLLDWFTRLQQLHATARSRQGAPIQLSPDAAEVILLHQWPENLRGLQRLVHELCSSVTEGQTIELSQLPGWLLPQADHDSEHKNRDVPQKRPAPESKEELAEVLEQCGSIRAAAKHYGRDRRQIYRWLKALGLHADSSS